MDLDMEILLNQVGGIFKPEEEAASNEDALQAANVQRQTYENRGMAAQDRKGPKKNPDNRSPKQSNSEISKLIQAVFDMKAEMGCMRKALSNTGITIERSPNVQKPREQHINGKQKNKFVGAAKKNKPSRIAHRSLMPVTELSDSDDESQLQCGAMTIVLKPKKHVSPRLMNSMLVGITRSNSDFRRISGCDASVDRVPGNDEIDAQMSFDGYATGRIIW